MSVVSQEKKRKKWKRQMPLGKREPSSCAIVRLIGQLPSNSVCEVEGGG